MTFCVYQSVVNILDKNENDEEQRNFVHAFAV